MRRVIPAAGLALALLMAAAVTLLDRLLPSAERQRDAVVETIHRRLGRNLTHDRVELAWDGGPALRVVALRVSGPPGTSEPQLTARHVLARVDVKRTLSDWGRRLHISHVVVVQPELKLTRNALGDWNFSDVTNHVADDTAAAAHDDAQASSWGRMLHRLELPPITVVGGRIVVEDQLQGRILTVEHVQIALDRVTPLLGAHAVVDLAFRDGAHTAPLHLDARVMPLPDGRAPILPGVALTVSLSPLELGPWSALLPWEGVWPAAGTLRVDMTGTALPGYRWVATRGSASANGLVLARGTSLGQPSDVHLDVDILGDLDRQQYVIRRLDLQAPSLSLRTRLQVEEWSLDGMRDADIALRVIDVDELRGMFPPGETWTGWHISGPLEATARTDANHHDLRIALDEAHVRYAGVFDKPPGTSMHIRVAAERRGPRILVHTAEMTLDDVMLAGSGDFPLRPGEPFSLQLDTGTVPIRRLAGVLPEVKQALRNRETVRGEMQLRVAASVVPDGEHYDATLRLRGMDVSLPHTVIRGDANLLASIHHHRGTTTALIRAPLDDLQLRLVDARRHRWLDKPRGMRASLHLRAVETGDNAHIERADLRLGRIRLTARGEAHGLEGPSPTVELHAGRVDIPLDDVRKVFPETRVVPRGMRLRGNLVVTGNPWDPDSVVARVDDAEIKTPRSHVTGTAVVRGLVRPFLDARLVSTVDLSEIRSVSTVLPNEGVARGIVQLRGRIDAPSLLTVKVDDLDVALRESHLRGEMRVVGLDEPHVTAVLHADKLVGAELLGPRAGEFDVERSPHGLPAFARRLLSRLRADVELHASTFVVGREVLQDVSTRFSLRNGVLRIQELRARARGGAVQALDSEVDLRSAWARSQWKLRLVDVDLAQLTAGQEEPLGGRVNADLQFIARGRSRGDIIETMQGTVRVHAPSLRADDVNLVASLRSPLRRVLPLVRVDGRADPVIPAEFTDVRAEGRVARGVITLTGPMTLRSPLGFLRLQGRIHLDGTLALHGTSELEPDQVATLTGGKYRPMEARTTPLSVRGTLDAPEVRDVELGTFVEDEDIPRVIGAAANTASDARQALVREAQRAREQVAEEDRRIDERARADAQRAAEELRRRAEELRRRAAPP
ncbi:MAG: AsmA-like C-terminal region-containing protein [Myxococcota bacterium]